MGASHSGADIAYEVARETMRPCCRGSCTGRFPHRPPAGTSDLPDSLVRVESRPDRAHADGPRSGLGCGPHGGPLIRISEPIWRRSAWSTPSQDGRREGRQAGARGRTGARRDQRDLVHRLRQGRSWIDLPVVGPDGWPEQSRESLRRRLASTSSGCLFLFAFASMLVGGVGRDADHVARHIAARADDRVLSTPLDMREPPPVLATP